MEILSIRGENIASLAKPFELRLDREPLAAAGLFAITGETGAGKSSLLDAMCLALYGDCPRLSGSGTREDVEDTEGRSLKATDARMVLRRGAARGMAEVTFRGTDGAIYTAGWTARRARDRIDGRLQSVDRSLVQASDGTVLETQVTQVNARVADLTGLTYDEFRRTVLLAQGDFDAFLGAQTAERAAILEKVTGTEVYRDISKRIYERFGQAQGSLQALEIRRGEHRLLTPEDRAALETEADTLRQAQAEAGRLRRHLAAELGRYTAMAAAQAQRQRAQDRLDRAGAARAALDDTADWMQAWERARPLKGELHEAGEAETALRQAQAATEALNREETAGIAETTAARDRARETEAALTEANERFKAFGPVWDEAAALDSRIDAAAEEARRVQAERQAAEAEEKRTGDAQEALGQRDAALEKALAQDRATLAAIPGQAVLSSQWDSLEERLTARIDAARRSAEAQEEEARLIRAGAAETEARDRARQTLAVRSETLAALRAAQREHQPERAALRQADPAARLGELSQRLLDLRTLQQAAAQVSSAQEAVAASAARRARAAALKGEATKTLTESEPALTLADHAVSTLQRPVASAEAALSTEATHLRQHLKPGAPCPVCHATSHPVLENPALAQLAADLRAEMDAATGHRDELTRRIRAAQADAARAEETIAAEDTAAPERAAALAERQSAFDAARKALSAAGLSDLPEAADAAEARAAELIRALPAQRAPLERDRARLEHLDREQVERDARIEATEAEIRDLNAEVEQRSGALALSERQQEALRHETATAAREIAALDGRLAPQLAPLGHAPGGFDGAGTAALSELRDAAERVAAIHARIAETEAQRGPLAQHLARAAADHAAAQRACAAAQQADTTRQAHLRELREARAALLDGEATGAHRSRHNARRMEAQKRHDAAREAQAAREADQAALSARLSAARQAVVGALARRDAARTALQMACAAAGLTPERVQALLGTGADEVEAHRQALKAADAESASAAGALKDRHEEVTALEERGLPDTPQQELEAQKGEAEKEEQGLSEKLGALRERQAADMAAREALAGLEEEIRAAEALRDTWAAVNEAVGSASGDRFARIAQAVTLGLLVERANLHLETLKPRYRLAVAAQDLALHVIDRDMAGDIRPTRLLSGGERFLVSLSLALALSGMGTRGALAGTLFIDEGFGSLDAESLDLAIDGLERLQAQGRMIGVISHVQAMKDRIPVQVEVTRTGGGASEIALRVT